MHTAQYTKLKLVLKIKDCDILISLSAINSIMLYSSKFNSGLEKGRGFDYVLNYLMIIMLLHLAAKSIQSSSLSLQCIHDVHGCNRLSLSMLRVSDCVSDHILQEDLQYAASLFVD